MRILGFSRIDWQDFNRHCLKLLQPEFTTWRWQRRDKPWQEREVVQVVLRPRSKERLILGEAGIKNIEIREPWQIKDDEARMDGFGQAWELSSYLNQERHARKLPYGHPLNRLMIKWLLWYEPLILYAGNKYEAIKIYPVLES